MSRSTEVVFVKSIPVNKVRIDGGTQIRTAISEEAVADYAENIESLPPVVLYFDGTEYWLADGFHRYFANKRAGRADIQASVRKGTVRDAKFYAIGCNKEHGLPRSTPDKRSAVIALLDDAEWGKQTQVWIAKHAGVTQPFVSQIKSARADELRKLTEAKERIKGETYNSNIQVDESIDLPDDLKDAVEDVIDSLRPPEEKFAEQEKRRQDGLDAVGRKLPKDHPGVMDAFGESEKFRSLKKRLEGLKAEFEELVQGPAGRWAAVNANDFDTHVQNAARVVRHVTPYAVCPVCGGSKCDTCKHTGWLPEDVYKLLPPEMKSSAKPRKERAA